MGKNTFGKTMPRALSQNLKIMGEQIMLARKRRHLSMQDIADTQVVHRLGIARISLFAVIDCFVSLFWHKIT